MSKSVSRRLFFVLISAFFNASAGIADVNKPYDACSMHYKKNPDLVKNDWCQKNPVMINTTLGPKLIYDKSCALIISATDYKKHGESWPDLPSEYVDDFCRTLQKQGYSVRRVTNANSSELLGEMRDFLTNSGTDQSRLVLYFSGHGDRDKKLVGYIVPEDAPNKHINEVEFVKRSVSSRQIIKLSRESKGKHVLFLFDSCHSGALYQTRSEALTKKTLPSELVFDDINRKAREFIAATDDNATTPADSEFTPKLIEGFEGKAVDPGLNIISGKTLYLWLRSSVESRVPQFGDVDSDGGDMVIAQQGASKANVYAKTGGGSFDKVDIIYYRKFEDADSVFKALDASGVPYSSTRNNSNPDRFKTNTIACHSDGDVEPVKKLAKILITSGVDIMEIQSFRGRSKASNRIELLSSAKYSYGKPTPLSLEQVEKLERCPMVLRNPILVK